MATPFLNAVIHKLGRAALFSEVADQTDGELLETFLQQRSEAAFAALVHRHGAMVFGVCRRMIGNVHDAEDAFQATFLVLARKAASVTPRAAVGNWLYGVAFRTAQRVRAARARRASHEKEGQDMDHLSKEPPRPAHELEALLDVELKRLPGKYRLPLILCELENRPRKEVARQLKLPEGTLSSRLATARKMLAKRLARHGAPLSVGALALELSQMAASASVPSALAQATSKAASLYASGQAATGIVSASVATLTEGTLKGMFLAKIMVVTALVLGVIFLGTGLGLWTMANQTEAQTKMPSAKLDVPKANDRDRKRDEAREPAAIDAQAGNKEQPPRGIDAATVAAYEKLGAIYGGWVKREGGAIGFQPGRDQAENGLPGFRFGIFPQAMLPPVAVPFGLELSRSDVTDAGLKNVAGLKSLETLGLQGARAVTDEGIKELAGLHNLAALDLGQTKATDAGVKELAGLKNLATIDVSFTKVTAEGLRDLGRNKPKSLAATLSNYAQVTDAKLRVMRELDLLHLLPSAIGKDGARPQSADEVIALSLANSPVTDGVKELAGLKNLATLDLRGTKVTDASVAELRKALPACTIRR